MVLGPHAPRPEPDALSPYSLAAYLSRVAGPAARDIRVNAAYGSGHDGAWQVTAHLTWRTPAGEIAGGTTTLPQLAGAPAVASEFDTARLTQEERLGWTMPELDKALDALPGVNDPLAMLELQIPLVGAGSVVSCHAQPQQRASCESRERDGARTRTFGDSLSDRPELEYLSVQRASAPVTG